MSYLRKVPVEGTEYRQSKVPTDKNFCVSEFPVGGSIEHIVLTTKVITSFERDTLRTTIKIVKFEEIDTKSHFSNRFYDNLQLNDFQTGTL